jgi:hypothetical protein
MAEARLSKEHVWISETLDEERLWLETYLKPKDLRPHFDIEADHGFLSQEEQIKVFEAEHDTPQEHVRKLLDILKTKSRKDFESFCEILKLHNCKDKAEKMRASYLAKEREYAIRLEQMKDLSLNQKSSLPGPDTKLDEVFHPVSGLDSGISESSGMTADSLQSLSGYSQQQSSNFSTQDICSLNKFKVLLEPQPKGSMSTSDGNKFERFTESDATFQSTSLHSHADWPYKQYRTSTPAKVDDQSCTVNLGRKRRSTEPTENLTEQRMQSELMGSRSKSFPEPVNPHASMPSYHPFSIEQMLHLQVADILAEQDKNWDDFGRMMGLSPGDIKKIRDSCNNDDHRCVVMLEKLEKKHQMSLEVMFNMKLKNMPDIWSQKFWTAFQMKKTECEDFLIKRDSSIADTPEESISDEEQERIFQTLSETDDFGIHYWRIGRLLGLSPSEVRKIEESYKCIELNKRALEVLRRWKKNYGFSVRVLQSVYEYLEIQLHPFVELLSSSRYMESVNVTDDVINSIHRPFAAILVGTAAEYRTVAAYLSQDGLIEQEGEFGKFQSSNDPCLREVQISAPVHDEHDRKHILHLFFVSFKEKGGKKSFVVYNPHEGQAKQATSELLQMAKNHNWPLDQFYIVGSCSVYCAPELQKPLGYLVLAKYLDDYNSGDVVDNTVEFHSSPREMSKDLYDIIYNWSRYGPAEHSDWAIPYVHAERVCSAPRRMSSKEIATKLLGNDKYLAIEVDGVGLMTVKEVVDVLYENERRPMKYIVVKGASHFADKTLDGGKFLAKLFNCESKEYESEQRQKIATLHSIAFVTRCIVQRIPPGTGEKNSKSKSNFEKSLRTAELKFDFDEFFKVFQKKI